MVYGKPTTRAAFQAGQTVSTDQPTAPAGERQEGGTLTVGTNDEPDSIHPWITQTVTGSDVMDAITEGMLAYDNTQQLVPMLATGYSIADDGRSYTFTLREGIRFHNGDPFTPEDVVNSWKMIMNPEFGAFNQSGWDKVENIVVDGQQLVFTLTETYAPFLSYVGIDRILPSSGIALGPDEFKQTYGREGLVGTGPFTMVEWRAKEQIVMDKFDDYWGRTGDPRPHPLPDRAGREHAAGPAPHRRG
jgi:peptide/nickel transport system substrate-binding protein